MNFHKLLRVGMFNSFPECKQKIPLKIATVEHVLYHKTNIH